MALAAEGDGGLEHMASGKPYIRLFSGGANLFRKNLHGAVVYRGKPLRSEPRISLQCGPLPGEPVQDEPLLANLSGALLSGENLYESGPLLCEALQGRSLSGAVLPWAILRGAVLQGAKLSGAHLYEAEPLRGGASGGQTSGGQTCGGQTSDTWSLTDVISYRCRIWPAVPCYSICFLGDSELNENEKQQNLIIVDAPQQIRDHRR